VDTPDAVIVPLDVPATASATLEVAWEEPITRTIAIDSSSARQLLRVYLKGGKAPPAVARVLEQVLSVQEQLDDKRKERQRVETDHAALSRDSQRVRDNLNVLRKTTGNDALQRDLARKLAALESQLGQLSGARVTLSEAIAELDKQLTQLVKAVTLEPK
jgi:chromosome segregation ATPase